MENELEALRGWTPADPVTVSTLDWLQLCPDFYEVVSEQRSKDGTQQFIVAADLSASSAMTGTPRAAAVHFRLDPAAHTCQVRMASAVTFGWAGHWLVGRGADPRALAEYRPRRANPWTLPYPADPWAPGGSAGRMVIPEQTVELTFCSDYDQARPGDLSTRMIEDRIRRSGGRYRPLARQLAYHEGATGGEREASYVLLLDQHPWATGQRFLLQLETTWRRTATYTLSEGGFQTMKQAEKWLDQLDARDIAPLPATNPVTGLRAGPANGRLPRAQPGPFAGSAFRAVPSGTAGKGRR